MRLPAHRPQAHSQRPRRRLHRLWAKEAARFDARRNADDVMLTENGRLGPSKDDRKEVKILNRIVRWIAGEIEYEADPRQAERPVSDLGLDDVKRVGTPGVKHIFEMTSRDELLAVEKHTAFRAINARGNSWAPISLRCMQLRRHADGWLLPPSLESKP